MSTPASRRRNGAQARKEMGEKAAIRRAEAKERADAMTKIQAGMLGRKARMEVRKEMRNGVQARKES